jgi:hypothetical protein
MNDRIKNSSLFYCVAYSSSRPFTLVVGVDAPLLQRFNRYNSKHGNVDKESKTSSSSLTTFVHVDHAVISCENLLR